MINDLIVTQSLTHILTTMFINLQMKHSPKEIPCAAPWAASSELGVPNPRTDVARALLTPRAMEGPRRHNVDNMVDLQRVGLVSRLSCQWTL